MKSIIKSEVEKHLGDFADNSISSKKVVEAFSTKVFNNLDDADKKAIVKLADAQDFSNAKAIVKTQVNLATDFANKNTLSAYKRKMAPKYYDESKSVTIIRKHKDIDTKINFEGEKVSVTCQFAYEMPEKEFKSMKNKTGNYLSDGVVIHKQALVLRKEIQGSVDKLTSDFTARIIKQVEILLGINTVTGTQLPIKIALFGKLDKVNDYYFNNNMKQEAQKKWTKMINKM